MFKENIEIVSKLGLHARASGKLVETASRFASSVKVGFNGKQTDAKSIMGVMMLAAPFGSVIQLSVEGADAERAFGEVKAMIDSGFGEN